MKKINSLRKSTFQERNDLMKELLPKVASVFSTQEELITSKSTDRKNAVYPRQLFSWVAYYKLNLGVKDIAIFLNYCDHSMAVRCRDAWEEKLNSHKMRKCFYAEEYAAHKKLLIDIN